MLPTLLCVCGQTLHPKKGFLWNPRTFSCPVCSFTVRLETEGATLDKATQLVDKDTKESWDKAVAYASIALAVTPDSPPWKWVRAFALDKLKQYPFAISDWTACIEARYRAGSSAMKRGVAYWETGKYENAIRDFDSILYGDLFPCLRSEPINQFDILMMRGRVLCDAGRFDEAARDFDTIAEARGRIGAGTATGKLAYWQLVARYRGDKDKAKQEWLHT
jgi:tetratricopeptide (TPR) repeat protein